MAHTTLRNFFALAAWAVTIAAMPAQSQTTPPAATPQATQPATQPATPDATPAKKTRSKKVTTDPSATAQAPATAAQPAAAAPPQKGMVWVNTASGVYHSEGTKYYGKTKQGKYMTEADAQKAGYHAAKEKKS